MSVVLSPITPILTSQKKFHDVNPIFWNNNRVFQSINRLIKTNQKNISNQKRKITKELWNIRFNNISQIIGELAESYEIMNQIHIANQQQKIISFNNGIFIEIGQHKISIINCIVNDDGNHKLYEVYGLLDSNHKLCARPVWARLESGPNQRTWDRIMKMVKSCSLENPEQYQSYLNLTQEGNHFIRSFLGFHQPATDHELILSDDEEGEIYQPHDHVFDEGEIYQPAFDGDDDDDDDDDDLEDFIQRERVDIARITHQIREFIRDHTRSDYGFEAHPATEDRRFNIYDINQLVLCQLQESSRFMHNDSLFATPEDSYTASAESRREHQENQGITLTRVGLTGDPAEDIESYLYQRRYYFNPSFVRYDRNRYIQNSWPISLSDRYEEVVTYKSNHSLEIESHKHTYLEFADDQALEAFDIQLMSVALYEKDQLSELTTLWRDENNITHKEWSVFTEGTQLGLGSIISTFRSISKKGKPELVSFTVSEVDQHGNNNYNVRIEPGGQATVKVKGKYHAKETHFAGYKAVRGKNGEKLILKMAIPKDAKIASSIYGAGKFRTNHVVPIKLYQVQVVPRMNEDESEDEESSEYLSYDSSEKIEKVDFVLEESDLTFGYSFVYDKKNGYKYELNQPILAGRDFNPKMDVVCTKGIHFCLTMKNALEYHAFGKYLGKIEIKMGVNDDQSIESIEDETLSTNPMLRRSNDQDILLQMMNKTERNDEEKSLDDESYSEKSINQDEEGNMNTPLLKSKGHTSILDYFRKNKYKLKME